MIRVFVFAVLFGFLAWAQSYPGTIPNISRMNSSFLIGTGFSFYHLKPERSCHGIFAVSSENLKTALRVTDAATEQFKRRQWPPEFLSNRSAIVANYLPWSEYVVVYKRGVPFKEGVQGTLVVTGVPYSEKDHFALRLPEEETLGIELNRPLGSSGKGMIFEFRTFSLLRETNVQVFPFILERASRVIFEKLRDFPELYDEPIIHTYADRAGILLYGPMGFKLTEQTPKDRPIEKYGVKWWAMAITPRQLEKLILELRIPDETTYRSEDPRYSWIPTHPTYSGFNQALPAPLPGAPHAMAAPGTHMAMDENGKVASTILAEDTKFDSGIVAAKGAHVVQFHGFVVLMSAIAENYLDPSTGRLILKGSSLSFHRDRIIAVNGQVYP